MRRSRSRAGLQDGFRRDESALPASRAGQCAAWREILGTGKEDVDQVTTVTNEP